MSMFSWNSMAKSLKMNFGKLACHHVYLNEKPFCGIGFCDFIDEILYLDETLMYFEKEIIVFFDFDCDELGLYLRPLYLELFCVAPMTCRPRSSVARTGPTAWSSKRPPAMTTQSSPSHRSEILCLPFCFLELQ